MTDRDQHDNSIRTHYVKGGFAKANEIVLCEQPTTRVVFRPGMSERGVRGFLIRQKKNTRGGWRELNEVDFRKLPNGAVVSIELDSRATEKLYNELQALYTVQSEGVSFGDNEYQVVVVDDTSKAAVIAQLLEKGYSDDVWKALATQYPDVATRLAAAQIQIDRQAAIQEFEGSLEWYSEDEDYWQSFFRRFPWMIESIFSAPVFLLGEDIYVGGKIAKGRQGLGGVATDFLFADDSTKSFSVVEIKTPASELVGPRYRGKGEELSNYIYSMHSELSGAVVQVRNQIAVAVDQFEAVLGKSFQELSDRVHPKGVLITGMKAGLNKRQLDSLNLFRHSQYNLAIITYDELLKRLQLLFVTTTPGKKRR